MKLKDALDNYYYYSGKASDLVRQLGFVGIAIIWVFRLEQSSDHLLPREFLWPGVFIVLALTLDFLQYIVATAIWGLFHRKMELSGVGADQEFDAPRRLNWPTLVLFWTKAAAIVIAYVLLGQRLLDRLF